MPTLPFKLNQDRRHHIPKQKHKVTNWREYDASLRQRGSLTIWFSAEAIEGWGGAGVGGGWWRRAGGGGGGGGRAGGGGGGRPGSPPRGILTALTLRAVFRL